MIIELSEQIKKEVSHTTKSFGYKTEREFVEDALRRRILELKKTGFLSGAKKIKKRIGEVGISEKDILEDFEKFRNSKLK
jgi:hypothetical protein